MKVENVRHEYRDSFGNGVCEREECGRDRDDAIHHTLTDMSIVIAALETWEPTRYGRPSDGARAKELATQCRMEGGLAV